MSRMQLVRRRSFGDAYADALAAMDTSAPIVAAPSVVDLTPPTIDLGPTIAPSLSPGDILPATPGTTVLPAVESQSALTSDLPGLILSGQLAPPSGSGLSSDQVAQIRAAGGSSADIQAILAGQTNATTVLAYLKTGLSTALAVKELSSAATPGRATPVTAPTAAAGATIGTTSIAQPLSALTQSTIWPGVPNWVLLAGGVLAAAALASSFGGGSRR